MIKVDHGTIDIKGSYREIITDTTMLFDTILKNDSRLLNGVLTVFAEELRQALSESNTMSLIKISNVANNVKGDINHE